LRKKTPGDNSVTVVSVGMNQPEAQPERLSSRATESMPTASRCLGVTGVTGVVRFISQASRMWFRIVEQVAVPS
jgi:hypothetical protein